MIGRREVFTTGLAPSFWNDVYHAAMMAGWPAFLGGLAATFVLINAGFALLYAASPGCIANAQGRLLEMFFFSVETLTTVGYGELYPQTDYAHVVVSVETFTGLFFSASMLGLIFARLSRPSARLLFANVLVVGPDDGELTLVMRVANARLNMISSATARVWLAIQRQTKENVPFRRFLDVKLVRSENPIFSLSWTLMHRIDEDSPFHRFSEAELTQADAFLIVAISGHDETAGQQVHARETYAMNAILWNHRYVDILEHTEEGMTLLNYDRFHSVEPIARSVP